MKWFKRVFGPKNENTEDSSQENKSKGSKVKFLRKEQDGNSTYEIYEAADAETAKYYLSTKKVDVMNYYILVETSEGNWGLDVSGFYLEHLLPFQKDVNTAQHKGHMYILPDMKNVEMAAKGFNESYIVDVECGNCKKQWKDAVRYLSTTVVRCPNCKGLNSVNTDNINVLFVESGNWPVFDKFLSGLGDKDKSLAQESIKSASGHTEVLSLYNSDKLFDDAIDFVKHLPASCHPICVQFKEGGGIYVRGSFESPQEYKYFIAKMQESCTEFITECNTNIEMS